MNVNFARNQAEELGKSLGITKPPVDVEAIAKSLGLRVIYERLGPDVSGLLITSNGANSIAVQGDNAPHRQRFTIAHEIGHYVLRHQFERGKHVHVDKGNFISQRSSLSSTGMDPKEIEANQFAACLLMPSKLMRERVKVLGEPLLDHHVTALAKEFEVSEQAVAIRLTTLGLL